MNQKDKLFVPFIPILIILSCMSDGILKSKYNGFRPVAMNDGWVVSSPVAENMDSLLLDMAYRLVYDEDRFWMARSLLVLRNGRLVAEAYPHDPEDINRIQNIQSCAKSFTSVLTGIALEQGLIDSVKEPLSEICPELFADHPDKTDITIEYALTMRTGIDFDNDENTLDLYQTGGSSADYVLGLPKDYPAGIVFHYNDGAPHLISAAIQRRAGKTLAEFADENLFIPLGIDDWQWESANDGITFGAFSLYLKPRDIARFGQMLLDNGGWNGQQVVDSAWIAQATQPLVTSNDYGASYGFYFWVFPGSQAFSAIGHGGQRIYIVPSENLVIVYTAWPYTSDMLFDHFTELSDLIIESCF